VNQLRVIVNESIQRSIRDQVLYIARHSVKNAKDWEKRLYSAIDSLADHPGHALDEDASERLGHPVRKLTFEGTYLIH
jgi:plasmid stabilization system protein ParE